MISASDFVHLPYSSDLTEAGIVYARRALPLLQVRVGIPPYGAMRRMEAALATQLAFQRYLSDQGIPFDVRRSAPFNETDHYDLRLGGRRCEIKTFFISNPKQITDLDANPEVALRAPALVPLENVSADGGRGSDGYVFCLVTGTIDAGPKAARLHGDAARPEFLLHIMPAVWARPKAWAPLRPLALKVDSEHTIPLELGGQDVSREFLAHSVELTPGVRTEVDGDFHSLTHLHVSSAPPRRLGIHSPGRGGAHLIQPCDWKDIWIVGRDICVLGWITRDQFRRRAKLIPEGSRVFQFSRTRTKNLGMDVSDLKPVRELLGLARRTPR